MQLWLWTNVEMGEMGLGFAGNCTLEGDETNIVVMKPDIAPAPEFAEYIGQLCRVPSVAAFQWLARRQ